MRIILIVLLIVLLARIFTRVLLPYALKCIVDKVGQNVMGQNKYTQPKEKKTKTPPKNKYQEKKKVGEYIDYEEIDKQS